MSDNSMIISDLQFNADKEPDHVSELLVGTGTSTWNINSYVDMKVAAQNDKVVRQTNEYYPSKSFKLKRCMFTCILNTLADSTGYTSRVGIFDDHADKTGDAGGSGLFFEYTDNVLKVGVRYGTIDNGTDTLITQANFNENPFNTNSHLNVTTWNKMYTFEILYNTIGTVEWAVYIDGDRILLHSYTNVSTDLSVIPRFNLPIRFEITKTGAEANEAELRQYACSVSLTNGFSTDFNSSGDGTSSLIPNGNIRHLNTQALILYTINSTSFIPVFSFRLKAAYVRNPIRLFEVFHLSTNNSPFMYHIIKNPTFNGTSPSWVDSGYTLEYDNTANTVDNGSMNIIYTQYIDPDQYNKVSTITTRPPALASNIAGVSDIYTVVVKKIGNTKSTTYFSLRWSFP